MDGIDRQILDILHLDGRASFSAIGREVGLSTNAIAARVRRLETAGVITGYTVVLAESGAEPSGAIEAIIDVRLQLEQDSEEFLAWVARVPGVIDAVHVTGPYDYLLRLRVPDMPALDRMLRALKRDGGVMQTQTRLALR